MKLASKHDAPHWLETRIPPPVVMLALGLGAWLLARALPGLQFAWPQATWCAIAIGMLGLGLNLYPKTLFRRAATTVNPLRPDAANRLVVDGVYRYTRNPMYLGHAIVLLAWAIYLQDWLALPAVPMYLLYVARFQIQPEERALSRRFPQEFARYRHATRRWL